MRTLIIATHQPDSVRNQEGVALWVLRVCQRVGMINEAVSVFISLIASYFYVYLMFLVVISNALVLFLKQFACCGQHALQLVSAGSIFWAVSTSVAVAVAGNIVDIIYNVSIVSFVFLFLCCDILGIICLIGADIHRAVLDTIGKVHIFGRQRRYFCFAVLIQVFCTCIQTLAVCCQTEVERILCIFSICKWISGPDEVL